MDDDLDILLDGGDKPAYDGKRPPFLTVLCILTFVGTGLGVLASLFTLWAYSAIDNVTDTLGDLGDANDFDPLRNSYRWAKIGALVGMVANFVCLAGSLVMWKMRKVGYYIYVVGQAAPLIVSFLSMGSAYAGYMGGFGIMSFVAGMIFPIGFVIMYGLNLKHMR